LFDKLKSFYFEISRYRKWLDAEQIAHFTDGGLIDGLSVDGCSLPEREDK
jgi:hypothetical protein